MKKLASILALVALSAVSATVSFAGSGPGTGVNESMHDINVAGGGAYQKDDFQRVCVFCHTPHNALPNGSVPAPLWNHDDQTPLMSPYTWAAPANLGIAFNSDPLVGPSRLCMNCHDGITAVDKHGSAGSGHNGNTKMSSSYTDGLGHLAKRYIDDLTVTHPIGFLYADAVTARNIGGLTEIVTPDQNFLAGVPANPDTKSRGGWPKGNKKIGDTLYSGWMTCASCHEVHNTNNVASTAALSNGNVPNYFLWAPEQQSTICLSCHVK